MKHRVMHPALWFLMSLHVRARMRRLRALTRTWKGRIVLAIGLLMLGAWLLGSLIGSGDAGRFSADTLRTVGAAGIGLLWVMTLVFGRSEGGVAFRPAEVEFLFPAPIPRRHLLLYRIISASLISVPSALIFSLMFRRNTPMWIGAFAGIWLTFQFVTLSQVAWHLVTGIIEQNAVARSKRVLVGLVAVGVVGAMAAGTAGSRLSLESLMSFVESPGGRILLAPFVPYASVLAAETLAAAAFFGVLAAAINFSLIALILRLDGHFMEASVAATQRVADQIAASRAGRIEFKRGNRWFGAIRIPLLPRLGGAGPVAWHQLTAMSRSAGGILVFVAILTGIMAAPAILASQSVTSREAGHVLPVLAAMSIFLLPQFLPFDFRGEVDRMPTLKSLPLHPLTVAIGELATPVLAVCVVQVVGLAVAAVLGSVEREALLVLGAFLLPANLLVIAAENLVFLLFPFRVAHAGGGQDLQAMFRVWLTMMLKMLLIALSAGVAAAFGGLTYWASDSPVAGFVVAWMATAGCCMAFLPAIAWAFAKFDPASDSAG